ncbi:MAG: tetraacyldisaccharide 4'-kinase, partial [Gammaproteobacteria bacterium]
MSARDGAIGRWLQRQWYARPLEQSGWALWLVPFGAVYALAMRWRRALYARGVLAKVRLNVPVVVVGNVAVGGTGKTPLTVAIVECLRERGLRPGVLCRGYGGRSRHWPRVVEAHAEAGEVGDEAILLRRRCACPVAAGPDRAAAGRALVERQACDGLVCDDGLQQLALERDVEIAVIDAARGQGNGRCLPAGPLRESPDRLESVDLLVEHVAAPSDRPAGPAGPPSRHTMWLRPGPVAPLNGGTAELNLNEFSGSRVRALAGIGNPERFFRMLEAHGLDVERHPFADHHDYGAGDLDFDGALPVLVTEKDAVKLAPLLAVRCKLRGTPTRWSVPVSACLDDAFAVELLARLADAAPALH